jgi:hypothetical protein
MSIRVDTASLISGSIVCGNRGLGVLASTVPSTGDDGPGYIYNDLSLPGDAAKEVRGLILTVPTDGLFYAYEDSSFAFTGAATGSYTFTYRLFSDGADEGTATGYLTVGYVVGLTGLSATIAAGTVKPSATVAVAGQAATTAIGTVTPATTVAVVGLSATIAAGTVKATAGSAGQSATGISVPQQWNADLNQPITPAAQWFLNRVADALK